MLSPSSCHSCVWIQASPLNFTNVAASTVQLALSLSRAPHTQRIYLYGIYTTIGFTNPPLVHSLVLPQVGLLGPIL